MILFYQILYFTGHESTLKRQLSSPNNLEPPPKVQVAEEEPISGLHKVGIKRGKILVPSFSLPTATDTGVKFNPIIKGIEKTPDGRRVTFSSKDGALKVVTNANLKPTKHDICAVADCNHPPGPAAYG